MKNARIIPTRMGTRESSNVKFTSSKDHPHAYGDKVANKEESSNVKGSSPRVWGQDIYRS